ncbi:hypothetical protein BC937DRAFT_86701, partial [Endogone sp. FLAS-F59071]
FRYWSGEELRNYTCCGILADIITFILVTVFANAAHTAAAHTHTMTTARQPAVYLYRHIQTSQVLVSFRKGMKSKILNQILDQTARPPRLRKDHWMPVVAITGFKDVRSAQSIHDALLERLRKRQQCKQNSPDHLALPKRLRTPVEQNQLSEALVSLREIVQRFLENKPSKLKIRWDGDNIFYNMAKSKEAEAVAVARYGKEEGKVYAKEEVDWPDGIKHTTLVLKRGRTIEDYKIKY